MAKDKKGFSLNGNTGSLLKVGVIIATIALTWGSMSSNVDSVGEKVDRHLESSEKSRTAMAESIAGIDKMVDANCIAVGKIMVRQENYEKAQDALIEEVGDLRVEQRTNTDILLTAIEAAK